MVLSCIFLMTKWCWAFFSYACWLLYMFGKMWKNAYSYSPLFNWLSFCSWGLRALYILCILDSYQVYDFTYIFSHFVCCLFTFYVMFFMNKSFNFCEIQYIFFFCGECFGVITKKPLANPRSWRYNPIIYNSISVHLAFSMFRSMFSFKSVFVYFTR